MSVDISRITVITLCRPESRNALNRRLLGEIWSAVADAGANPETDVVILTGADPAFCAGVDLKELANGSSEVDGSDSSKDGPRTPNFPFRFFPVIDKPIVGAINGPAATAGLELALQCTFLVASERAKFADTHVRVGVMPGAGMTALLPQAVGLRRATQMSLTGSFISAEDALAAGLVNSVVSHEQLLAAAQGVAEEIAENDPGTVRQLLQHYRSIARVGTLEEALDLETALHRSRGAIGDAASRGADVIARGRERAGG